MSFFRQFPKIGYDFELNGVKQNVVDIFRHVKPIQEFIDNYTEYRFYEVENGERPDVVSERIYGSTKYYWTFFIVNDFLHDGYRAWPMSQEDLHQYIDEEYNGYAIVTRAEINPNNSIAGRFQIGETIQGNNSGAKGTLFRKNLDNNQLIVRDMQNNNAYEEEETIQGNTSNDFVVSSQIFKYADAPYYYYKTGDTKKRPQTNALHIQGAKHGDGELSFTTYRQYEYDLNETRSTIRVVDPNYIGRFAETFEKLLNA